MKNIMIKNPQIKKEKGQTMILMVVVIAATALAAIAFSSFTVISEIKQVTDARATSAALFAADTGIECILFREFGNAPYGEGCPVCNGNCKPSGEAIISSTGARFTFEFVSRTVSGSNETMVWRAIGKDSSGRTVRSLQLTLRKLI